MKITTGSIIALALSLFFVRTVQARNDKYVLPIQAALETKNVFGKPDGSVKFFYGKQRTPQIISRLGSEVTHGRVAKLRNTDEIVCGAAFLGALLALHKRAKQVGANAVVNIVSFYQQVEMSSGSEFECHAGMTAHVYLKGELVKINEE